MVRELINNCIAHQDYTIGGRIYVNEFEDKIKVTNPGDFLPGNIEVVLEPSYAPPFYRNQLLSEIMTKLSMIDTATMGIRKIYNIQRNRFFPLPDYDLNTPKQVSVTVYGKIINENYTHLLYKNEDFDLNTVFLLDKIQKGETVSKEEIKMLRKLKVIEGRAPNVHISANIAKIVDEKAQYIKNKGFDETYYKDLIIGYLREFGKGKKKDFIGLLFDKLPDNLNEKQKENKVKNMLSKLKKQGLIARDSENIRNSSWILVKKNK